MRWKNKNEAVTGFHHISLVSITDLGSLMRGYLGFLAVRFRAFFCVCPVLCFRSKEQFCVVPAKENRRRVMSGST